VVAVTSALVLVAACTHDGRTLRAPDPTATTTTTLLAATTTTANQPQLGSATNALVLSSEAFFAEGAIPGRFTCDGENISPPLSWTGVPEGTAELAISLVDPDASGFVHWVVTGLAPQVRSISIGAVPESAFEGHNDHGTDGWFGPCPPAGAGAHHYVFTLYALRASSGLTQGAPGRQAVADLSADALATVTLTVVYTRAG
jgi:Raf kinase inhibitor-like YbhB/YbcL family protein